jgi:molecular chaperone GrpE
MTLKEIYKVFEQFGITPIESMGKTFDPAFHQAMMQEETEAYPENTVSRELQKGYMIHDRLLRPAMVVVSKKKEASENILRQTKK